MMPFESFKCFGVVVFYQLFLSVLKLVAETGRTFSIKETEQSFTSSLLHPTLLGKSCQFLLYKFCCALLQESKTDDYSIF